MGTKHKKSKRPTPSFDEQKIEDNLKRTVAERIRRHQIALETMEKLQKAKKL